MEAHAVAGELVLGVYFILASVATYLGVTFATNQDAQKGLSDWFYSMGDDLKSMISGFADNWVSGYNTIIQWESSGWATICKSCSDFFSQFTSGGIYHCNFNTTNPSNFVGFTPETGFSFTVPSLSNGSTAEYVLPYGKLVFFHNVYYPFLPSEESSQPYGHYLRSNNGLTGYYYGYYSASGVKFYTYKHNNLGIVLGHSGAPYSSVYVSGKDYNCYYDDVTQKLYYPVMYYSSSKPFVLKADDDSLYTTDDGTDFWSDQYAFGKWFYRSCGFVVRSSEITEGTAGVYVPGLTNDDVKVDSDRLTDKVGEAQNLGADDTFSTVLPGSQTALDEMSSNPDLVTDVTADWVYSADIPTIKSDPLLWQTKFPFCLPFDLYNLFTGFTSEAEAPVWHLLVLPENSFGMENEAFYFDIDFGANGLDVFVKYMRFFIAAAFVVWLIMISRKLIGGE